MLIVDLPDDAWLLAAIHCMPCAEVPQATRDGWIVYRRYADFAALHRCLQQVGRCSVSCMGSICSGVRSLHYGGRVIDREWRGSAIGANTYAVNICIPSHSLMLLAWPQPAQAALRAALPGRAAVARVPGPAHAEGVGDLPDRK